MNREIKFRAWDTVKKEMHGCIDAVEWLIGGEPIRARAFDGYETHNMIMGYNKETPFILLQFTGLKDNTGKDIYEGDVIPIRFFHNNPPSKRPKQKYVIVNLPVIFKDGEFKLDDYNQILTEYGTTYRKWYVDRKVIGNIFEHPELIKP